MPSHWVFQCKANKVPEPLSYEHWFHSQRALPSDPITVAKHQPQHHHLGIRTSRRESGVDLSTQLTVSESCLHPGLSRAFLPVWGSACLPCGNGNILFPSSITEEIIILHNHNMYWALSHLALCLKDLICKIELITVILFSDFSDIYEAIHVVPNITRIWSNTMITTLFAA